MEMDFEMDLLIKKRSNVVEGSSSTAEMNDQGPSKRQCKTLRTTIIPLADRGASTTVPADDDGIIKGKRKHVKIIPLDDTTGIPTGKRIHKAPIPLEDSCGICMDDMCPEDTILLNCQHLFHPDCALEWINRSGTCPVCRHPVGQYSRDWIRDMLNSRLLTIGTLRVSDLTSQDDQVEEEDGAQEN